MTVVRSQMIEDNQYKYRFLFCYCNMCVYCPPLLKIVVYDKKIYLFLVVVLLTVVFGVCAMEKTQRECL